LCGPSSGIAAALALEQAPQLDDVGAGILLGPNAFAAFGPLVEALRAAGNNFHKAFELYQRSPVARTARIVLSAREMGRIFHAKGVGRLVRHDLWEGRTPERFYDAMEWLYGWKVGNCLAV
jgi:hypothetical protein